YVVTVGFGTPKKELPLVFDTGSDLTWTQCEPCVKYCYQQTQPIFDPTASASYANISPGCSSSTCVYGIQYGDSSYSIGFFASETLTLTPKDKIHNFLFGCGQNNRGLFGLSAGLLGLGRDGISLVSQTAKKYNKLFSYCLPSSSSSIGYLTFGPTASSQSVKYTPFSTISGGGTSYYWVDITGIRVGGKKLSILASVFTNSGTIIDSGTVITRLPPDAYSPLRDTFKKRMKQYRTAPPLSILDTCYDLSKYSSVSVPKISFLFSGGVEVPLDIRGILYVNTISQVCLAFAGNREANDAAIFGNTQQLTLEVLYDGNQLALFGFSPTPLPLLALRVGSAGYVVTIGLGTPESNHSLIIDTGSDLTWLQCRPCAGSCYSQNEPIFDPSASKSYANISCDSLTCLSIISATGNLPGCSSTTCEYGIRYGDGSYSIGNLARETLALSKDKFDNFEFGCGQNNGGNFNGSAGLLGLGHNRISIISQTKQKYNKIFSMCLPSSTNSTGFLTFGSTSSQNVAYTPFSFDPRTFPYYGLEIEAISVGDKRLPIFPIVFLIAGTIIDSGTVITRLPPVAYVVLRDAFSVEMTQYPRAPALSILDTCYDFSNIISVTTPTISFFFRGGVEVPIDSSGIFYAKNRSQVCLAFAGNANPIDVAIFGSVQQKTIKVVYNVRQRKIGFAPKGCT
ncbi:Asp domain-containing protein, partial [Cephalotus follicularis]